VTPPLRGRGRTEFVNLRKSENGLRRSSISAHGGRRAAVATHALTRPMGRWARLAMHNDEHDCPANAPSPRPSDDNEPAKPRPTHFGSGSATQRSFS
jgi:hypothetical protein